MNADTTLDDNSSLIPEIYPNPNLNGYDMLEQIHKEIESANDLEVIRKASLGDPIAAIHLKILKRSKHEDEEQLRTEINIIDQLTDPIPQKH
jgi:hypothetical protein